MGDMDDTFRMMRDEKKKRHAVNYEKNMTTLINCDLAFDLKDAVVLFREVGKPKIDFYPHSGKWKSGNKIYNGGAQSFLNWYKKQRG